MFPNDSHPQTSIEQAIDRHLQGASRCLSIYLFGGRAFACKILLLAQKIIYAFFDSHALRALCSPAVQNGDAPLVLCYPDALNQVWTNLVHNALQAMDNKGTLTVQVSQVSDRIRASIPDTGKGIPPKILPRIFEPFFTTKRAGEGSGLGLHIVKQIVDKHCGTIQVESAPCHTTFTACLPLQQNSQPGNPPCLSQLSCAWMMKMSF